MVKTKTQFTINVATQVKEALESMLPCLEQDKFITVNNDIKLHTLRQGDFIVQVIYFLDYYLVRFNENGTKTFHFGTINFADKKDKERIIEAFLSLMHVYGYGTKLESSIIFK